MVHPSYRLKWHKPQDRDTYIQQLTAYRNKKRNMKPQLITVVCLVCGRGEFDTRYMDTHYYCGDCKQTVSNLRQKAHYKKRGGYTKYGREYKREYQRRWSRINWEGQNKSRREHHKKYGRQPHKPVDPNSWKAVRNRCNRRRHTQKMRWFRPIKARLLNK